MPDTRAEDAELLDGNIMRETGIEFKGPRREAKALEVRTVNPHHKGAKLSGVARALNAREGLQRSVGHQRRGGRAGVSVLHSRVWQFSGRSMVHGRGLLSALGLEPPDE